MLAASQNRLAARPSYVQTLTRVIHRHTRRRLPVANRLAPTGWVNDEEFEILESGILTDENIDSNWLGQRTVPC
jgi:hypothetical protein